MSKQATKQTTIQLIKYGIIGASNTLITLAVFYIVNTVFGLSYAIANVLGYVLGLVNSFIWNRNWVFKTHNSSWLREAALFFVGFAVCYGLQLGVSYLLLNHSPIADIELAWLPMKNTSENIVICLSMVVYTIAN